MDKSFAFASFAVSCLLAVSVILTVGSELPGYGEEDFNITLHISKRNSGEEWSASFNAEKTISNSTTGLVFELRHTVDKTAPNHVVRFKGLLKEKSHADGVWNSHELLEIRAPHESAELQQQHHEEDDEGTEKLRFQQLKGKKAVLVNDRRTAFRTHPCTDPGNSWVVTDRPLKDEELFQVQLDNVIEEWKEGGVYIGVIQEPPADENSTSCLCKTANGTWVLYRGEIRFDGKNITDNYPITGKNLKVNDRIGVMRRSDNSLHFFLNDTDMGEAATNVSSNAYGFVDIANYVIQISIVD